MFRQILIPGTGVPFDSVVFQTARMATADTAAHFHVLFARPDPAYAAISMSGGGMDGGSGLAALIESIAAEDGRAEAATRLAWEEFSTSVHSHAKGLSTTLEVTTGTESTLLIQHGRTSDLLVIGRPHGGQQVDLDRLATVLVGIGRPMLIAAPACPESLLRTVVIAWKDTAEAARAVGAAMPFIARAERVLVMTAGEAATDAEGGHPGIQASAERLVATLQRHAPLVHAQHVPQGSGSAADALLAAAVEKRAGLMVMGGYGHGALRERVFGGFTQTVLGGAELPVLMMR